MSLNLRQTWQSSSTSGSGTTVSLTGTILAGDLLVAVGGTNTNVVDSNILSIAGFTKLNEGSGEAGRPTVAAFYKVAVGNESSVSITNSATTESRNLLFVLHYRGADPINPIYAATSSSALGVDSKWVANARDAPDNSAAVAVAIHSYSQYASGATPKVQPAYSSWYANEVYAPSGVGNYMGGVLATKYTYLNGTTGSCGFDMMEDGKAIMWTIAIAPYVAPPPHTRRVFIS